MEKTHGQNSYKIKSKIVETEVKWIPLTGDGSKFLGRRGVMGAEGTNAVMESGGMPPPPIFF